MGERRSSLARTNGTHATPVNGHAAPCALHGACAHVGPDQPMILRFFMIHNMTMRIGDRLTAPIGLTSSRWMLLCAIKERQTPPTLTELSVDAMLSPQNVSRMVGALEDEGLVQRVHKPGAGRAVYVRLTARGKRACDRLHELGERFHERFLRGVSEREQSALAARLDALIANLDAYERQLLEPPRGGDGSAVRARAKGPAT